MQDLSVDGGNEPTVLKMGGGPYQNLLRNFSDRCLLPSPEILMSQQS